jgi:hypothetical protein
MGVATGLHPEPGLRGGRQIGGHYRGRTAEESKWQLRHPSETNRDELWYPALVGFKQQLNWIASILGWFPSTMRPPRHGVTEGLPFGAPLVRRKILAVGGAKPSSVSRLPAFSSNARALLV